MMVQKCWNTGSTNLIIEMSLINSEINLLLTWSSNCVISNAGANQATTFAITDTKRYVQM